MSSENPHRKAVSVGLETRDPRQGVLRSPLQRKHAKEADVCSWAFLEFWDDVKRPFLPGI